MADLDRWPEFAPERQREMFHPHWWTFDCLYDARRAAARYLRTEGERLGGVQGTELHAIAALYEGLVEELGRSFRAKDVFLGPWTGRAYKDWTDAVRADERLMMARVMAVDGEAAAKMASLLTRL